MTASEDQLATIHNLLAISMTDKLMSGEAKAADWKVIAEFLKENDISAIAAAGSPLGDLVDSLPNLDDLDNVVDFG